ncbi:MAG: hypothetical protein H6719_33780 [Sandaracinaceae bacterium]|nr:hypothetical protein [Sandaracinaceae bacterium]
MGRSFVTLFATVALGCAANPMGPRDAGGGVDAGEPTDAALMFRDGGSDEDGGAMADAGSEDAGAMDAGLADAGPTGTDAGPMGTDAGPMGMDAGTDAGTMGSDAGPGGTCPLLNVGDTVTLDGTGDLAAFPMSQRLAAGGSVGGSDQYGITWDRDYLYIALSSPVFADGFRPIHVYLEARPTLGAATASSGKFYDSLTAGLPFTATHLIAVRRTSTGMDGIAYNGVYTPAGGWTTLAHALTSADVFAEGTTALSVRVPWSAIGCATTIRLAAHVVNGPVPGNEWKDFVPLATTPWLAAGGTYYEIDLTADPAVTGWLER